MGNRYIISITAANRVGLLAAIGTALDELGGNIEELCQTVMQEFFSVLMAVEFPEHRDQSVVHDHLYDACRPFDASITVRDSGETAEATAEQGQTQAWYLTIDGPDQPGLMGHISAKLAARKIDIRESYGCRDEQEGFFLVLKLAVPPNVDGDGFRTELAELGRKWRLTVNVYEERDALETKDPRLLKIQSSSMLKRLADTPDAQTQ